MQEKFDPEKMLRDSGYVRIDEYAFGIGLQPVTVRGWITQGLVGSPDVVMVGNVNYIRKDLKKPTRDRSKRGSRKGRYSYDDICSRG